MRKAYVVPPGSILVGNTLVSEAARLVAGRDDSVQRRAQQFLELSALIEAVILHETLYTLPADLPPGSLDLPFRQRLLDEHILMRYESSQLSTDLVPTISRWLMNAARMQTDPPSPITADDDWRVPATLDSMISRGLVDPGPSLEDHTWMPRVVHDTMRAIGVEAFADLTNPEELGPYYDATYLLRSLIYWQAGEMLDVPWYPSVMRVPLALKLGRVQRAALAEQLYAIVARAYAVDPDTVHNSDKAREAIIAPLTYLVLSQSRSRDDVIVALLKLRGEFAEFRRNIAQLEEHRHMARTWREIQDAEKERTDLVDAVTRRYVTTPRSSDRGIYVRSAFSVTKAVVAMGMAVIAPNPLSILTATGEVTETAKKLSDAQVRLLWNSRPATELFHATKKLEQRDVYDAHARRLFGVELGAAEEAIGLRYDMQIRDLLGGAKGT